MELNFNMINKYAVWKINDEDNTKRYIYADSHYNAKMKYAVMYSCSAINIDTQKV